MDIFGTEFCRLGFGSIQDGVLGLWGYLGDRTWLSGNTCLDVHTYTYNVVVVSLTGCVRALCVHILQSESDPRLSNHYLSQVPALVMHEVKSSLFDPAMKHFARVSTHGPR